jgi:hypothetical protein
VFSITPPLISPARLLADSSLLLHPSDKGSILRHFCISHMRQSRHVAKIPMMGADPLFHCQIEASIAMMVRDIHSREKRWRLRCANTIWPMASSTMGMKQGFPGGEFQRHQCSGGGLESGGLMLMAQDPSEPQEA